MQTSTIIKVAPDDIDQLGHVNYLKYILFLERAVGDWYRQTGVDFKELRKQDLGTVVLKFDITYLKEARLGDTLTVTTTLMNVGNKSFTVKQEIYNQDNILITEATKSFVMFNTATRKGVPVIEEIARHYKCARK
ncbi:acyl-CoA thioesterase [Neobacillus dielmonensis]|uniref:acyl-CoA thioesterase n=1 Tax=Neobacillus dielmonensis TaxID=1347369 RepID=UPI0005A94CED|nr:thioesterase family protein [Neobacillus dielmonensis]